MNSEGKIAVITGVGGGMRRAPALAEAKAGAKVVVSDILKEDCRKVVAEIEKWCAKAIAAKCDVREKSELEAIRGFGGQATIK